MPPAPGRFSGTTVCPSTWPSFCASTRPEKSIMPPGEYGMMKWIGRDGKVSARAGAAAATASTDQSRMRAVAIKRFIRSSFSGAALPLLCSGAISASKRLSFRISSDQLEELGRGDRHLRDAHIEWRERIFDCRDHRRGGGDDADFADALDAERIVR